MARPSTSSAMRKELRGRINARIEQLGLTNTEAGKPLQMTAAQVSRLRSDEDIFSLDRLVDAAVRLGLEVHLSATRPYREKPTRTARAAAKRTQRTAA